METKLLKSLKFKLKTSISKDLSENLSLKLLCDVIFLLLPG